MFHAGTWVVTAIGLGMLWRAGRRPDALWSTGVFVGALLMGWGLFDLVEGLDDGDNEQIHPVPQRLAGEPRPRDRIEPPGEEGESSNKRQRTENPQRRTRARRF
ncbi:MAG: DUF2243 domain-containing protein [Anaerolineae bacterium]